MGIADLQLVMRGVASAPLGGVGFVNLLLAASPETGPVLDTGGFASTSFMPGGAGGPVDQPLIFAVIVPHFAIDGSSVVPSGTTPTLVVKLQHSDDNATYEDLVVMGSAKVAGSVVGTQEAGVANQITAEGEYRQLFSTKRRYLRYVATITGTSANFGPVQIRIEEAY